jgi:RNA polymerase sigma factor (sigma-70 family)
VKWELATNEQLLLIIKEDKDCPKQSLRGVVMESLDRGLFNKLIYWVFDNLMKDWRKTVQAWNMENEDILSMGYCGVLQALNRWEPGKSSFKSFAYMNIRSEFTHAMDQENTKKREINKHTESYDVETSEGEPVVSFFSGPVNVEKEAIRNVEYQSKMNQLTELEYKIVTLFLEGYRFSEINQMTLNHRKNTIKGRFYEALAKIGLGNFTIRDSNAILSKRQKLTPEIVREIRFGKRQFKTKDEEAAYYGVSRALIRNIRENKTWKEVV